MQPTILIWGGRKEFQFKNVKVYVTKVKITYLKHHFCLFLFYSNSERSELSLATESFFNLFLEVSHT